MKTFERLNPGMVLLAVFAARKRKRRPHEFH
jgi:hypothetical protein